MKNFTALLPKYTNKQAKPLKIVDSAEGIVDFFA